MRSSRFTTILDAAETGIMLEIPAEAITALGTRKRPPVWATLNEYRYRTTVSVYGGRFYLPIRKEIRQTAKLEPGMSVTVVLELDEAERTVEIPEDLDRALAADPEAEMAFQRLAFTHRKEYVVWVTSAKRAETRDRRIEKTIVMLREGRQTP